MIFDKIPEAIADPIFGKQAIFSQDPRPEKINLMIGVYKDDHLKNHFLSSVQKASNSIKHTANYLPIYGHGESLFHLGMLCFGNGIWEKNQNRIYAAQTVGGTGAIRVGAEFISKHVGKKIYLPSPTWANHHPIFENSGFQVSTLPYYDPIHHGLDLEKYLNALHTLEAKSVVLFHPSCHNPTGTDPSFEDWKIISQICKEKEIIPFFDFAYQGFGDGIEEDAKGVRFFVEEGHECLIAYSCSKNFSLYCQRMGALFVVCNHEEAKKKVASQVKKVIRPMYSNPPSFGAELVLNVLQDPTLQLIWRSEVDQMRERIVSLRRSLQKKLSMEFDFIGSHKGMFSYLDLNKNQVKELIDRYAVYTLDSGRINIAGLHPHNLDRVVSSILSVKS